MLSTLDERTLAKRLVGQNQHSVFSPFPDNFFEAESRPAAVLIPLTRIQNSWHILFIRRTQVQQDRHSGQVAFPGGRMDPQDRDIQHTAVREACEEVGLDPADIRILGQLNDFVSITNYRVTPFVGVFPWPYPLRPDHREVSRIFTVPLSWLAEPGNHESQFRSVPGREPWPVIYFQTYDGELLWGFTARITLKFIEVISKQEPE